MTNFPESLVEANARALCADDFVYATERGVVGARQWNDLTDEDRDAYRKNARPGAVAMLRALRREFGDRQSKTFVHTATFDLAADQLEAKTGV